MDLKLVRKLQLAELEMAKKFVAFCDEHNLRYFMLGGTFLGAVRHKGFIPWDDDMDFGLLREDYDKFLQLSQKEQMPFEVQNYFTGSLEMRRYFTRIIDPSIKVYRSFAKIPETSNIWVDVFPLDGMPNQWLLRKIWGYYLMWRRAALRFSIFSIMVNTQKPNRPPIEKLLVEVGKRLPVEKIFKFDKEMKKLDKAARKYPSEKSNYLLNVLGMYKLNEVISKDVFGDGAFYEFEGQKWRGPQKSNTFLTQIYGDYMTPPPESERNWHKVLSISEGDEGLK